MSAGYLQAIEVGLRNVGDCPDPSLKTPLPKLAYSRFDGDVSRSKPRSPSGDTSWARLRLPRPFTENAMNDETFNLSIRKFLKMVGVSSQRDIEQAVAKAVAAGETGTSFPATMRSRSPASS